VNITAFQVDVNGELNRVQIKEFLEAFQKLYDRAKACIYANVAYF
jgi:hypothetical protein